MHHSKGKQIHLANMSLFPYAHGKYFQVHDLNHDPVCDWIAEKKAMYEHYILMMLTPLLRECSYLVDIGCHVGTFTYAKQLVGNFNRTLSIDASQDNIDLAKTNLINQNNFDSIYGFWTDTSNLKDYTMLSNDFKGKGHHKLHSSITNNPSESFKIPNIKTSTISDWIHEQGSNTKPGFIKIDIDGSEENTSEELCASLIRTETPVIMLIETGNFKVIEALTDLGMMTLALLPGSNFLLCSQSALQTPISTFLLHQTLILITGYLNKIVSDENFIKHLQTLGAYKDNKAFRISTQFGELTVASSITSNHWQDFLSGHNIPMFCYG